MSQEQLKPFELNPKVELWTAAHRNGGSPSSGVQLMKIQPRTPLVGDWLKAGDLGFIFAARGVGKTWFSMHLAKGLAIKEDFGPWKTHHAVRVLYLDGEMPPEDLRDRDIVLGPPTDSLYYVNHEILFQKTGLIMNLADFNFQAGTLQFCLEEGFNVIFFDNLSTLSTGVDENKSLDWELIGHWLLTLRRNHITAIVVHHAGRNNQMRGSSKREDPAFWIIRLDEDCTHQPFGASFISRFTKWRNSSSVPPPYRWNFEPIEDGRDILITFKAASSLDMFLHWVDSGLDTCSDIAIEMGVTRGYISQLAKQALSLGRIQINGRRYQINEP